MTQQEQDNYRKYLHPPSLKEIIDFVELVGVSDRHFEKFYGMPLTSLSHIRAGNRTLQAKFWHFFYEKIIPAYGSGFVHEINKKQNKRPLTKVLTDKTSKIDNHGRLSNLKTK